MIFVNTISLHHHKNPRRIELYVYIRSIMDDAVFVTHKMLAIKA